jgi:broad specificity phosphatase PhoE
MKIYLIRHGHYTSENENDGPLTEKGIIQIQRLAKRFIHENIRFNEIYSSSLLRASQSAKECSKIMGIEGIVESNQLVEAKNHEDIEDVSQRVNDFMKMLNSEDKKRNSTFGIFSHCYTIKYFLNSFKRDPNRKILPHAGFVLLEFSDSTPRILEYASNSHLEGIESY